MRARRLSALATLAALTMLASSHARAAVHRDTTEIDQSAKAAYEEGKLTFCKNPTRPLGLRQQGLCELAPEIDGCEGFAKACNVNPPLKDLGWLERLLTWLAPLGKALLYILVLAIVLVIAVPVIQAILKRRRDQKLKEPTPEAPNRARNIDVQPIPIEAVSDAEAALRLAEEHRSRGELKQALALYLAASLAALDRRGAIRIARHRTNGEYVRGCQEETSRPPLREIVREVDKVEFGGAPPTDEGIARVAGRAQTIVRVATSTLTILAILALSGCSPPQRGADPAGDELPIAVLERNGFKVGTLGTSLATMPIRDDANEPAPLVIVDVERVPLEEEAQAHMMRWVEAGGVLVLFGHFAAWPSEIKPEAVPADTRDLVVRTLPRVVDPDDDDNVNDAAPIEVVGGRVARRNAFTWKKATDAESVAFLGNVIYAAKRRVGKGLVLGVANDDLFTNVGMMPTHNAAALVELLRSVTPQGHTQIPVGQLRVARPEDGIPPPSNPFAALVAAGLGKGAWHALAAAVILFLAFGIRRARPRPAPQKDRRAFAEHVEATAAIYGRTRAYGHALGAYGRFLEMRLRESVPRGTDPIAFLASRSGVDRTHIAALYDRATKASSEDAPQGDELNVLEELRRIVEKALGHLL